MTAFKERVYVNRMTTIYMMSLLHVISGDAQTNTQTNSRRKGRAILGPAGCALVIITTDHNTNIFHT